MSTRLSPWPTSARDWSISTAPKDLCPTGAGPSPLPSGSPEVDDHKRECPQQHRGSPRPGRRPEWTATALRAFLGERGREQGGRRERTWQSPHRDPLAKRQATVREAL